MNRKTIRLFIIFPLLIAGVICAHMASAATIVGSKHDFSTGNTTGSTPFAGIFYKLQNGFPLYIDEVCIFCHTPHGASSNPQTSTWLWNRVSSPPSGYTYAMYSSSTLSAVPSATPTGISLMCMSCHDGVTSLAVNTLVNSGPGNPQIYLDTAMTPSPGAIYNVYAGAPPLGWGANLGDATATQKTINMTNDHPISFEWNYTKSDLYGAPTNSSLRLFGASKQRLECATCHRVHDPSIPPFLAMSNSQSAMCLACHIK